eukprot:365150-Chlamydomonas_euryale.AAC.2
MAKPTTARGMRVTSTTNRRPVSSAPTTEPSSQYSDTDVNSSTLRAPPGGGRDTCKAAYVCACACVWGGGGAKQPVQQH